MFTLQYTLGKKSLTIIKIFSFSMRLSWRLTCMFELKWVNGLLMESTKDIKR